MSEVICIYKYIILTCYVFWLTTHWAFHSWGSIFYFSLCAKKTKQTKTSNVFQHHWNQMQFFIHWSHKAPCEGWAMKRQPATHTPPWEDTREPTALHTASLTKQYWYHWLRSALDIAVPRRFECNDMDFGSVCYSRKSCRGALFFKENKKKCFFINSCFVGSSLLRFLFCNIVL